MTKTGLGTTRNNQRGAALAVSLILLLVMTLIGIAAMDGARLEISMAGLMQQDEVALRRAERTLVMAEADIESKVATAGQFEFGTAGDGFYVGTSMPIVPEGVDWSSIDSEVGPENSDNGKDDDDASVVEYLGAKIIPGEGEGEETDTPVAGSLAHAYRITTRSASGGKSVRMVESIYTTFEAP